MVLIPNDSIGFPRYWVIALLLLIITLGVPICIILLLLIKMPSVAPSFVSLLLHWRWQESFHHLFVSLVLFDCSQLIFLLMVCNLILKWLVISVVFWLVNEWLGTFIFINAEIVIKDSWVLLCFGLSLRSEWIFSLFKFTWFPFFQVLFGSSFLFWNWLLLYLGEFLLLFCRFCSWLIIIPFIFDLYFLIR